MVEPVATETDSHQRPRIEGLDALRGLAAMAVVLLHMTTDFTRDYRPDRAVSLFCTRGGYGVHLFFLISGFVIFMTVERTRRPIDFVISRFSRLFPAFWVAVILTTLALIVFPLPDSPGFKKLVPRAVINLTMIPSWLGVTLIDSVYWTLQVELFFYLVMLILIWLKAVDRTLTVLTTLVLLALGDHMLLARPLPRWYEYLRNFAALEFIYLFTAGVVLYRARRGWKASHLLILLLCVACPATAWYAPNNPPYDTTIVVALIALVHFTSTGRMNFLAIPPLLYLGTISYSLYLTHHMIGMSSLWRLNRMRFPPDLALLATLGLCLLLATAIQRWVEKPALRRIRGWTGKTRPRADDRPVSRIEPDPAVVESAT